MLYRLIVLTGPLKNQRITVDAEPMNVGRAPDCEISIPDDEVAQKHALLEHKPDGGLQLRDLGTMNKVLVNGREVRESRLKHGDMVEIGRTRFLVQAVVQAEVTGQHSADPEEGISPKIVIAAVLVLILGVITVVRWPGRHPKPSPDAPAPVVVAPPAPTVSVVTAIATTPPPPGASAVTATPVVAIAPPVDNQATQITAELRRLRDDLDSVKAIQHAQSNSTPPAPVIQAPPVVVAPAPPVIIPADPVVTAPAPVPVAVPAPIEAVTNTPVAVAVQKPKPAGRVLRVLNVTQSRLPPSDEVDDLRAFTITLAQIDPSVEIDNDQLRVSIAFYDEDEQSGEVHVSTQVAPLTDLRPSQPWGADRRGTVTATYALPKGSRAKSLAAGRNERYHGHVVRVEYAGREQDAWAQPRALAAGAAASGTAAVVDESAPGNPR